MIYYKKAQNLRDLVAELSNLIAQADDKANPLSQDWIVVQNKETQEWIHSELCARNGISANVKFVYPSELIWVCLRHIEPTLPSKLPTDKLALEARILDKLDEERDELSSRGLNMPSDLSTLLDLAIQIADVFDLYQAFRPELLNNWERKTSGSLNEWQPYLWNILSEDLIEEYPDIPGRSEVTSIIIKQIDELENALPNRIYLFGLSHWSKPFNQFIQELSGTVDIIWFDQDFSSYVTDSDTFKNWSTPKVEVQTWLNPKNNSDSSRIESITIKSENDKKLPEVNIHSCHNVEREIQVLKTELLNSFDADSTLTCDDVLILVPDFKTYAPIIYEQFNRELEPKIPFFEPYSMKSAPSDSLLKVFNFFIDNEKVSSFIEVLGLHHIKKAFSISDDELSLYIRAFAKLNVHSGLIQSQGLNSIEKGIRKLLLSYSMEIEAFNSFLGYSGIEIISTDETRIALNKLVRVLGWLKALNAYKETDHSLLEWINFIEDWLIIDSKSPILEVSQLKESKEYLILSKSKTVFPFEVFVQWLNHVFSDQSASATKPGSGVQVGTYVPFRNIPFKFVAMLGLNEGIFPRNPFRPEFDLIHSNPLPGDRITQKDDQLMFLERFISTEKNLHLSYIGEGEQGALGSTLIDALLDVYPESKIQKHALHEFSTNELTKYETYSEMAVEILNGSNIESKEKEVQYLIKREQPKNLHLNDLIQFFTHPSKYLLGNILGIKNIYEEDEPKDRDVFKVSALDNYNMKLAIAKSIESEIPTCELIKYLQISGKAPMGIVGRNQIIESSNLLSIQKSMVEGLELNDPGKAKIQIKLDSLSLEGELTNVYKNQYVDLKVSTIKPKHIIELWIKHLVLCLNDEVHLSSKLIGTNKDKIESIEFNEIKNAENFMLDLLEIFNRKELNADLCSFIPALSNGFVTKKGDREAKLIHVENEWEPNKYPRAESDDFYNKILWDDKYPWESPFFEEDSLAIWSPIISHIKRSKHG